jgi:hypothetical protein
MNSLNSNSFLHKLLKRLLRDLPFLIRQWRQTILNACQKLTFETITMSKTVADRPCKLPCRWSQPASQLKTAVYWARVCNLWHSSKLSLWFKFCSTFEALYSALTETITLIRVNLTINYIEFRCKNMRRIFPTFRTKGLLTIGVEI